MSRKWISGLTILGMAAAVIMVASVAGARDDKKPHTIKEVMGKVNKKGSGLINVVKSDLSKETPDWDKVQGNTKTIVEYVSDMGKNDPPKGDKAAWQKTTKEYTDHAKALDQAAKDKDLAAAKKSNGAMLKSCGGCHGAHKG